MSELVAGVVERISPRVRRILAPNPGLLSGPGTNTYLVGERELTVVDPGPADAGHLDAVAAAGNGRVRWIVATHTHPDHAPGCAGLRERTGALVIGFGPRDGFEPDESVGDGWRVPTEEYEMVAVHTPGHASNHLCWLLGDEGLLFSGDHVMQGSTVVISPPDGDMAVYLRSLERVRALGPELRRIAPGHGHVIEDPHAYVSAYIDHRREREDEVLAALGGGLSAVDDMVARIYADVAEELHPIARRSVHAHLLKLAAEGRARGSLIDEAWEPIGR